MSAAAWQRGFDLDALAPFARLFAAQHRRLVHGAFGLVRERDIAAALAAGGLLWKRGEDGAPRAAAIVRRLAQPGGFSDFAGREFAIPAGHARCAALAAESPAAAGELLAALRARASGRLWLEIFEEDTIARAALAACPALEYRATRIAAGSEIKGLYSDAGGPAAAPLHAAEAASLVVLAADFAAPGECAAMIEEIAAGVSWVQHYSSYNLRHSWTAFALYGYAPDDPEFIVKPKEMSRAWQAANPARLAARPGWTRAAGQFPRTRAVLERLLGGRRPDRVRFMKLAPGGELARHADITDREAGLADGRLARLHLPVQTNPGVVMHGWDKRGGHLALRFPRGALCYLDQRGPHRVENRNPGEERIHLVVDLPADAALRAQIAAAM